MFLTRFEINTARRAARELLASPQRMHAAVLAGFPSVGSAAASEGRVLWRLDQHRHQALLYLVSPTQPDLTHLVESVGWPATQTWATRHYAPFLEALGKGDQWAFRLTANPVSSRRKTPDAARTQRFAHVTVAQQTEWLLTRAHRHGFAIVTGLHCEPDVAVHRRQTLRFPRQGKTVTLSTAVFEGRLEVIDPELLRQSLVQGIGPGKGYGCGLLTLAR
ncbi:type I-E CRISPR-associated protein Cas6/Cse3/CasE [Amycolatopsis cynarae]|uniref:Type I-E CRISPR-associated protein Cas6/Cse3/CasE n=1 Tax=Amycolatopsis cynarae TaxID=2995223 RepID=A0ABY7B0Z6_9PSEU|nr:type I-E CRISPR-associated protein Cas6/Cse3/CasE [Amycolatopsis sp. HUAS 11-8]WAL65965.1 type I-E CRISPR-associated protein Cas6/Cse3/CasE [Amycolatopsis sp. HUAS 11-8]